MSKIEILSLKNSENWSRYIQLLPINQRDIYFTPLYYQLYQNLLHGIAKCFVYENNGSLAVYPFLINSINELGYNLNSHYYDIQGAYGYNGVISANFEKSFIQEFYNEFYIYCSNENIIAEFTRFHPVLENHKFSMHFLNVTKDRNTVLLDLSKPYEKIWEGEYSSQNRNKIRKAQKKLFSIRIIEQQSVEEIKSFIKLYQNTMLTIKADKYYFFNEDYFINIFNNFGSSVVLFEVLNNTKRIECAAIIFVFGIYAHYHLSGRTDDSDNSVNNFLLDEVIKYIMKKGVKYFHLGGGTTSSENDPLLKFKSNFSQNMIEFYLGKKIHNVDIYNEVVSQWELKFPEKKERFNNHLLKYRY